MSPSSKGPERHLQQSPHPGSTVAQPVCVAPRGTHTLSPGCACHCRPSTRSAGPAGLRSTPTAGPGVSRTAGQPWQQGQQVSMVSGDQQASPVNRGREVTARPVSRSARRQLNRGRGRLRQRPSAPPPTPPSKLTGQPHPTGQPFELPRPGKPPTVPCRWVGRGRPWTQHLNVVYLDVERCRMGGDRAAPGSVRRGVSLCPNGIRCSS